MGLESLDIRKLMASDAEAYQECRLYALKESPSSFGADYETRTKKPIKYFRERATSKIDNFIFGAFDGVKLIATVGFAANKSIKMAHRGAIWGVYTYPEYRSQGLARRLIEKTINCVSELNQIKQIELGAGQLNTGALALYKSFGFKIFADEKRAMFVEGEYVDEYLMVLKLDE